MLARDVDGPVTLLTVTVQFTSVPATPEPVCDLETRTSACAVTVVDASSTLFARFVSNVDNVTSASSVYTVEAGVSELMLTTIEIGPNELPGPDRGEVSLLFVRTQVTTPPVDDPSWLHDHPGPVADENVVPAGTVSVTVNGPTAVSGPLFETVNVHVCEVPATAVAGVVETIWTSTASMRVAAVADGGS